jgi:predicted PurR-regulated permease PerM
MVDQGKGSVDTTWSRPFRFVVGIGLAILAIYLLYLSRPVIPLFLVAALIAMVVRPPIRWLIKRSHFSRGLAVAVVYLGTLILLPLALSIIVPAIIDAVNYIAGIDYPAVVINVKDWLYSTLTAIRAVQIPLEQLDAYVDEIASSLLDMLQSTVQTTTTGLPSVSSVLRSLGSALVGTFGAATHLVSSVVTQASLVIFTFLVSVYISLSAHTYREGFLRLVPAPYRPEISILLDRIRSMWSAYLRGELTLMLVIGVMSWLGLMALGVPGAPYLGIVAGLLELIPNLGPIIATIPAVIVALLQGSTYLPFGPWMMAGLVILLYVVVQQLENNFIVPRILGNAVGLPALVVMLGVVVGASTAGILGALLATPIIASGREILRYTYHKILLEEPFPPEEALAAATGLRVEDVRLWLQEGVRLLPERVQKGYSRLRRAVSRRTGAVKSSSQDGDSRVDKKLEKE